MKKELFSHEYDSLRNELAENKRFMFERPALTVIAIISLTQFTDSPYINLIPMVTIGILIFNLVFTATRVDSYIRYITYLQTFHEGTESKNWVGWENFLRMWRIWYRKTSREEKDDRGIKYTKEAIPQHFLGYNTIFYFHLISIALIVIFSVYITFKGNQNRGLFNKENLYDSIVFCTTFAFVGIYIWQSIKLRPSKIIKRIEIYREWCLKVSSFIKKNRNLI